MKAVIFSPTQEDCFKPLTDELPELLLPVVGKPVVVHLIELLVCHGIKELIITVRQHPHAVENFLGNGRRWGAAITYNLEGTFKSPASTFARIGSRLDAPFIAMPANIITDLDITALRKAFIASAELAVARQAGSAADDTAGLNAWAPFIISPRAVEKMKKMEKSKQSKILVDASISTTYYKDDFALIAMNSPADWMTANRLALDGRFKGLLIPGKSEKDGIWKGLNSMIHPGAVVIPPVFIGENSRIHKKASIGPYAVVGSNAVVDESAIVSDSIIMEKTYVGSQTEIRNAAVRKNMLFHFQMATQAWVADDFILGDLESRKITGKIEDWCHRFLGVLLFAISLPVFGPLMIYSLIFRSSNYFIAQHCLGNRLETDMKGCSRCRPFKMYRFKSRWLALQKIPGLLNVIQGNLRLVGCLPPKKQDKEAQICKYNPQNRPAGLVHLWEVEGESGLTEEEVYVADNYFAATRTFKKDMIILAKFLLGFRARPK